MIPRLFTNMLPFAITVAIISVPVLAGGTYFPQHYFTGHRPVIRTHSYSSSRSRRSHMGWCQEEISVTELASRSRRVDTSIRSEERNEKKADPVDDLTDVSYNDLGPIGKTVAGCTEIVFATFFDYCSGYLQGLLFGTMFGSPGFVFRPIEKGVHQPFVSEMSRRFTRMNTRSMSWAKNFGSISAAFGGFGVAVKVLRNGEEDAWTNIISSAAAGAFFARKDGLQAMLRGALLYGGLIYATSGSRNNQLQEYTEKTAIDF